MSLPTLLGLALLGACSVYPNVAPAAQMGLSVARVLATEGGGYWMGSAVPIRCDRLSDGSYLVAYLTAAHVVSSGKMWIQVFDAPNYQFQSNMLPVVIARKHPYLDAGLLLVEAARPVACLTLDYRTPQLGEQITSSGYALGQTLSMDTGLVSSLVWYWSFPDWDGAYLAGSFWAPGCSGGAVMGDDGRLLGIIVGADRRSEHLNIFLPVVAIEDWLTLLLEV